MSTFQCELFGHFTYDESLSYQDLLDMEARFVGTTQELLESHDATRIDFTPMGDSLMLQCALDAYDEDFFSFLCEGLRRNMPSAIEGRLLFVDKRLLALHLCHISRDAWKGNNIPVPACDKLCLGDESARRRHPPLRSNSTEAAVLNSGLRRRA